VGAAAPTERPVAANEPITEAQATPTSTLSLSRFRREGRGIGFSCCNTLVQSV
jgi:hypothetical protein